MKKFYFIITIFTALIFIEACKKSSPEPTPAPTPVNPCLSKTITVSGTTTQTSNAGTSNGTISASATGSTGFTYSINGTAFQATGNFTGLAVGNFTVTAKDADGCTGTKAFTISAASCPTIAIAQMVTPAMGITANGSITLTASGGVAPYQYSKDNGTTFQASGSFTNLLSGNFNVVAKDANNCTASLTVTVASVCPPTLSATATPTNTVKCATNTGTLTIAGSGGAMPYTYSINGGAFQSSGSFSTLGVGNVTYVVKDANGCTSNGSSSIAFGPAGTGFTAVKNIMNTYCVSCHGAVNPTAGVNLTDDCIIVSKAARIKARCVDLNPSQMPPSGPGVTATEKAAITAWVAAGGNYNN
jgi:SprB repeat/Cytochrome C oxidase, cbb3-type, subunit III